jgi:L-lactate dehydrogenase complex protein LldF
MGAVLTPALGGLAAARHLPQASTLCGRCESVCPVGIPLPKLLRHWREQAHASGATSRAERAGLRVWGWISKHPWLYQLVLGAAARLLRGFSVPAGPGRRRRLRGIVIPNGWTVVRDLAAPEGETFQARWRRRQEQDR